MDVPLSLPASAAQILAGLLVLTLGRRLFWVFVGVVGFFFGQQFGVAFFKDTSGGTLLLLSVITGVIGAGLAVLLQRVAMAIAGGFAGGMLAFRLAGSMGLLMPQGQWIAFIAGALLAAVLITVLFDPALIFLSALTGAVMIGEALPLDDSIEPWVIGILFAFGVVAQMRIGKGRRSLSG